MKKYFSKQGVLNFTPCIYKHTCSMTVLEDLSKIFLFFRYFFHLCLFKCWKLILYYWLNEHFLNCCKVEHLRNSGKLLAFPILQNIFIYTFESIAFLIFSEFQAPFRSKKNMNAWFLFPAENAFIFTLKIYSFMYYLGQWCELKSNLSQ